MAIGNLIGVVSGQNPVVSGAPADVSKKSSDDAVIGSTYGDSVQLNLSPSAQSIVSGQASSGGSNGSAALSDSSNGAASDTTTKTGGSKLPRVGGGGGSVNYTDLTEKINEAKRKVAPQVGIAGANEVVDRNGNIDTAKLNQLLAQQK